MASIEEVRAGIALANDKASESLGALQQAHSSLEQAQGALQRVTEGSEQADGRRRTGCSPRPSAASSEVRQQVAAAIQESEGVANRCERVPARDERGPGPTHKEESVSIKRAVLAGVAERIGEADG